MESKVPSSELDMVKMFVDKSKTDDKVIAFVTSGGTSVPLEKNTVRSIENFSTG